MNPKGSPGFWFSVKSLKMMNSDYSLSIYHLPFEETHRIKDGLLFSTSGLSFVQIKLPVQYNSHAKVAVPKSSLTEGVPSSGKLQHASLRDRKSSNLSDRTFQT